VEERGRGPTRVLDEGDPPDAVLRQRPSVAGDVAALVRQPVGDLERRVAQRVSDRVPDRRPLRELEQQLADARAGQPAAQDAGEEGNRHEPERDEEEVVEGLGRVLREHADDELDEQNPHHERSGAENGAERPAEGALRAQEPGHDDREDSDDGREREHADDSGDNRPGRVAARDRDRAHAVRAIGVRPRVDQELPDAADEDEPVRGDHEPHVSAALQASGRIGEQQLHEGAEREAVQEHAERVDPVVARLRQAAQAPEVRDEDEVDPRAVVGPAPQREHPRDEEREPDRQGEREERGLVLQVVAREDEARSEGDEREPEGCDRDE
jgi:hypothetical protein